MSTHTANQPLDDPHAGGETPPACPAAVPSHAVPSAADVRRLNDPAGFAARRWLLLLIALLLGTALSWLF